LAGGCGWFIGVLCVVWVCFVLCVWGVWWWVVWVLCGVFDGLWWLGLVVFVCGVVFVGVVVFCMWLCGVVFGVGWVLVVGLFCFCVCWVVFGGVFVCGLCCFVGWCVGCWELFCGVCVCGLFGLFDFGVVVFRFVVLV
jgi:hypothetical protein